MGMCTNRCLETTYPWSPHTKNLVALAATVVLLRIRTVVLRQQQEHLAGTHPFSGVAMPSQWGILTTAHPTGVIMGVRISTPAPTPPGVTDTTRPAMFGRTITTAGDNREEVHLECTD